MAAFISFPMFEYKLSAHYTQWLIIVIFIIGIIYV